MPPQERNPKRPITDHRRYQVMLRFADQVDPHGRLWLMLVIARHTGRRSESIVSLRMTDLLLEVEQVRAALAEWGNEMVSTDCADVWVHGALRFRGNADKVGIHSIVPIRSQILAAVREYLAKNPTPTLGDAPLFPMDRDLTRPLSAVRAGQIFTKAETAAREAGETLPKLTRGIWHPYRRLFRNERRRAGFNAKEIAFVGGWTFQDPNVMERIYLRPDPEEVLAVVSYDPSAAAAHGGRSHVRRHTGP